MAEYRFVDLAQKRIMVVDRKYVLASGSEPT
jgi:hypothetical protein